ncbi:MAG TPA: VTC domain-containing protein [Flavobacteriales bacterium]|nr:VTC domain-containing protein [Flavobacteriales bacterium]HRE75458.1 polyphosphate polymerase domain-containing protein [Flavobacteriales bacterium]HRJ34993.1 polyphosphate polymerase domain-containing protein [Flavobacteriales bacterium]HRJ37382.1 polyphosphate polymerase domain-containing protein [Flavobacteriales bacterium]
MTLSSSIIEQFDAISLDEMDSVKLMNRTDTKFAFNSERLDEILSLCKNDYRVLAINGKRSASYITLYFDTPDHSLYLAHHNGKPYRYKIRIRNYVESGLFYLEIKQKIKGRTVKSRIKLKGFEEELSDRSKEFIEKTIGKKLELRPALWNNFRRITLVHCVAKERVTIDTSLTFSLQNTSRETSELAIAEVKQENRNRNSGIIQILRKLGIRESGISKYCVGSALIKPQLKYNTFKEKILFIDRLNKVA